MKKVLIIGFITLLGMPLFAQVNVRDSATSAWHFKIDMNGYAPGADLAKRYGAIFGVGGSIGKKTLSNWLFGVEGTYFFSNTVKNTFEIYGSQTTAQGFFIGTNGEYATVEFLTRGFYAGGYIGKILPILNHNPSSGLFIKLGGGFVQNQIYVRNPNGTYPQFTGEYGKGYDRLHNGFALNEQVGYLHSGNRRTINFAISFEFIQGFTQNQRAFNWDTRLTDTIGKLDLYFGLKLSWFLPVYNKNEQKFYYY